MRKPADENPIAGVLTGVVGSAPIWAAIVHDGDPELVTDGGSEIVFLARNRFSARRSIYHTDRECQYLDRAATIVEKPLSDLWDHFDECEECAGTMDRDRTPDRSHYEALKNASPDDPELVTDGGLDLVEACPDCDAAMVSPIVGTGFMGKPDHDNDYRCRHCHATFDEPVRREKHSHSGMGYLAGKLDDMDPDEVGEDSEIVTDGGVDDVKHTVTDRPVADLSTAALKAEWSEASEQLRGPMSDERQETVHDRRIVLWTEMRDRTDAEPPECPECGGQGWSQTMGDPKHCTSCGLELGPRRQDLVEEIDAYWRSVLAVDIGGPGGDDDGE